MLIEEQPIKSSGHRFNGQPKRPSASYILPLILTAALSLVAGGVGGAAVVLWGQSYLKPLASNSLLAPAQVINPPVASVNVAEESASTQAVKQVAPSVVSIIISKDLSKIYNLTGPMPFDDFFNRIYCS